MSDTPRKADYAWTTLARVLSVAHDRGRIPFNPCQRGGRLYEADRAEKIWTENDIARLPCGRIARHRDGRSCWRFGLASVRAIFYDFLGRPTTDNTSGCANQRPGGLSPSP